MVLGTSVSLSFSIKVKNLFPVFGIRFFCHFEFLSFSIRVKDLFPVLGVLDIWC